MGSTSLDRLLHDLLMIARQREGDRIYIADGHLHILHPGMAGSVWRWGRGDTRHKSLAAVTACIHDALALAAYRVNRCVENDQQQRMQAQHLVTQIDLAAVGLRHMRNTYLDDLSISATIDVLRDRISTQLMSLRNRLGDSPTDRRINHEAERAILYLTDADLGEIAIIDEI